MEYVEGIPLDRKIGGRFMPISESLDIAIQITDALDEAHGKGITHRDIKSSNIMITPRGRVKVLDFGLAKITQAAGSPERISDSEVATRVKTSPGVVMGTVNYMSPEQASGKEVDTRTDIWSLGVVLYEMVTGRLPFEGATPSHLIVAILEKEPLPLSAYVSNTPEALEWIVTETLTKDAKERTQTARELLKKLQRLKQCVDAEAEVERSVAPERLSGAAAGTSQAGIAVPSGSTVAPESTSFQSPQSRTAEVASVPTNVSSAEYVVNQIKTHKKTLAATAIITLALLVGIVFALYKFVIQRQLGPTISLEAAKFTRLTTTGNARFYGLAFSPDGNYVFYVVGTSNEATGTLYQVPVLGGTPRKLFTGIKTSISFSPDGKQIAYFDFYEDEDRLMIANADGSGQRQLAMRHGDEYFFLGYFSNVSWSPDGKTLAPPVASTSETYMRVATVSVATGELKFLTPRRWLEVRQVVWFDSHAVLATAEEREGESFSVWQISYPSGAAQKLTNDLNSYPTISLTADAGLIAAVKTELDNNIWMMPAFDASRATQITQGRNLVGRPAWTPDGKLIYPVKAPVGGDLYLVDLIHGSRKQLTGDAGDNVEPSVSPDGRYIVFMSDRTGVPHIWRMDIDGANVRQLTVKQYDEDPNISPDGQWIAFMSCMNKCTV